MSSPILWGPNSIANNLQGSIINSDLSLNKYNGTANYILNGHAELNTTGWATYANTAQATPVNGTGGSPTVTWTQTTTSPLDGTGSFVFTKDAVNRQGQGASYNFTIDSASQAKVLNITFDYIVGSGTFVAGASGVDSDLEIFVYDVTNSVLIQPTTYKLFSNSSTIAGQFTGTFQTPYNSTSYRLIVHCATTSASAYTVKFDNVAVSPSNYTYGTPANDKKAYTLTLGATTTPPTLGTVVTNLAEWQRVADSIVITWQLRWSSSGTSGTGTYLLPLPSGLTVDTSKISDVNTGAGAFTVVGNGSATFSGIGTYTLQAVYYNTTNFAIVLSSGNLWGSTTGGLGAASGALSITATLPITGWSSSVQMSDNTAQNVVAATFYQANAQTAVTSFVQVNFDTVTSDSTGSVTTGAGAWKYTAPVPGLYRFDYTVTSGNTAWTLAGQIWQIALYKNGSQATGTPVNTATSMATGTYRQTVSGSFDIVLVAGDYIDLRIFSSISSVPFNGGGVFGSVQRLSGPQTIGATDTISAGYYMSANTAISTTTPWNLDTKIWDNTGSVTTGAAWKFTAPISGTYAMSGLLCISTNTGNYIRIYKNGTWYCNVANNAGAGSVGSFANQIKLLAGDYVDFRPSGSVTGTGGSLAAVDTSHVEITRIGNY